ncbi:helix-turn-helix transcriptional regulator [Propionicicella superfundia]|uniref:helix-turn-helix transcriptional regulator n=1 Tax=Propionicicella superfundia TaxID=348582 RepID=UPI0005660205|nr:ArsR family transcriptional regulator [Propionicicella superfundia]
MAPAPAVDGDATTRERVARSILQYGPSTAAQLAERLHLTPAAVRRHLATLVEAGHLVPRRERVFGPRGRGRPANVFVITDQGRCEFYQAYDDLAIKALDYLRESAGPHAVEQFAEYLFAAVAARFDDVRTDEQDLPRVETLAEVLSEQGYLAGVEPIESGTQLCQYHCPVAHVAERYPQLCDVETRVFADLLGSHVQRLATIARGDGICTTHVPKPVPNPLHPSPRENQ